MYHSFAAPAEKLVQMRMVSRKRAFFIELLPGTRFWGVSDTDMSVRRLQMLEKNGQAGIY